ncbi:DUF5107 domain-containing protein [Actinocatenispora comari]|uniref:DUF5107 domain-containing protein n=1 Tax=Actinocatenispora comari TaxID=2807577 RepID=A0A8J4A566_9ACTN|nr:DUF5107 domain-containing protein [Actinocatenispora comari]GIL25199.1 hypothetical protein NUM_04540 [Actinocatenispora comari]
MSRVRIESLPLPKADIGPVNPLPPVTGPPATPYRLSTEELPAEVVRNAGHGTPRTLLPYLAQDGYSRSRRPGELTTVVLDNGVLRATFVPELGGRLWSLLDRRDDRELLYRNPVWQPANLALRNAWFAGGVEWNIGTRGHSPTTCSPLHAALLTGPGGVPMLRMWEYERLRGAVFQVDAWLPDGADALRVHVRIRATAPDPTFMYWWSNTAVPEDVRVLAPADRAFCTSYDGTIRARPVPVQDGVDRSYPLRNEHAADYFFDTAGVARPWIVALDEQGRGLVQTSTARLVGRKLFVWGTSTGGRHWADWLSPGNAGYAEIQAGLAATQYEHLPMPAGASWSWLETYGPVAVDREVAHGDWATAVSHVDGQLAAAVPPAQLDAELAEAVALADAPPAERVCAGSGWGALERHRRGAGWCDETGTPFDDDTLGTEQRPWLALLADGALPAADPATPPASYVGGAGSEPDWAARLAADTGWLAAYHRGVLAHQEGDAETAAREYAASVAAAESAWAVRGLGVLAGAGGRAGEAADLLVRAYRSATWCRQLAAEAGEALLAADRAAECLALVDAAPAEVREHGRIRLLTVRAALAAGHPDRARAILSDGLEVADLREGETSLDALWTAAFPDRPIPPEYDFRMH